MELCNLQVSLHNLARISNAVSDLGSGLGQESANCTCAISK